MDGLDWIGLDWIGSDGGMDWLDLPQNTTAPRAHLALLIKASVAMRVIALYSVHKKH